MQPSKGKQPKRERLPSQHIFVTIMLIIFAAMTVVAALLSFRLFLGYGTMQPDTRNALVVALATISLAALQLLFMAWQSASIEDQFVLGIKQMEMNTKTFEIYTDLYRIQADLAKQQVEAASMQLKITGSQVEWMVAASRSIIAQLEALNEKLDRIAAKPSDKAAKGAYPAEPS